eukprot:CAMPEP_0184291758 /NCGR_PEP_ID=MMETSP1049-20130417/3668_1 /TAXON_ID=77928 /ORGANISM="Proteomonas sulcata, Strain CCMP704" /LENGTH=47 /DNA_ID= /DNA_START= /DNA_END= /DNA_ORIENTATION=
MSVDAADEASELQLRQHHPRRLRLKPLGPGLAIQEASWLLARNFNSK